ncbi:PAS and ANTAR domain-containing protein [Rhodococcus sp. NM-2]|uniref:PAS and ANTAR domain-containing protein n=1 Tax=Rhodococcus jostii TaxID=132919 RepID=A0ABU4CS93_RHOJO|nr:MULTISPECIES: PAS and ANTAR domain-containing protein [Rhodococcus]MDI9950527.1 PAS and ANTAR domain-containing protein [Rhodococcus sp. IEGM 1305]MDI9974748.1 PAS and ANTAR domain-containing protein [Rhodococcus sp. IEGM 1307]MDV6285952.1 PAS and ANTAR domain-containing protein [Rhodococcus jostii]
MPGFPLAPADSLGQDAFTSLVVSLPRPVSVYDDRRQLVLTNPALADFVGYRLDEFDRVDLAGLMHPSDAPRWFGLVRGVLDTGTAHAGYARIRHRNGNWLWAHGFASTFTSADTRFVVLVWQDRTDDVWNNPRLLDEADVVRSRAIIEQAKGALMLVYSLSADAAFDLLTWRSQETNTKIRVIAEQLVLAFGDDIRAPTSFRDRFDALLLTAHERRSR